MSIKEQKRKVLKMLEDEVITQEQALDLLEMIAREGEFETVDEIKDGPVEPIDFAIPREPFDFFGGGHQLFSVAQKVKENAFSSITLKGKNSKIAVTSYSGDEIIIKGWYKTTRNSNPMIRLEELDGRYFLDYNYHGVRYLGFDVYIPETMIPAMMIENSNATVEICNIEASEIIVATKNASIDLHACESKRILATTKNSHIHVRKIKSDFIELSTTNAKLKVKEVLSNEADFRTTNATIDIQDSYIENSLLETKNAQIWLDFNGVAVEYLRKAQIEARTTNANIECVLPEYKRIPYRISGTTRRGNVVTDSDNLIILAQDKGYLVAQSPEYENEANNLTFNFQTTNGSIRIRDFS
ncbi:MAG: hypothetical protein ACRCVH_00535 [Vagococcus fluvialis]